MRVLVIVSALGLGGVTIGARQGMIPVPYQMVQTIVALGGDPAHMPDIHIRSLTDTFSAIRDRLEHPDPNRNAALGIPEGHAIQVPNFDAMTRMMQSAQTAEANGNDPFSAQAVEQSRQATEHAGDMANFTRNPGVFHGIPPR